MERARLLLDLDFESDSLSRIGRVIGSNKLDCLIARKLVVLGSKHVLFVAGVVLAEVSVIKCEAFELIIVRNFPSVASICCLLTDS